MIWLNIYWMKNSEAIYRVWLNEKTNCGRYISSFQKFKPSCYTEYQHSAQYTHWRQVDKTHCYFSFFLPNDTRTDNTATVTFGCAVCVSKFKHIKIMAERKKPCGSIKFHRNKSPPRCNAAFCQLIQSWHLGHKPGLVIFIVWNSNSISNNFLLVLVVLCHLVQRRHI